MTEPISRLNAALEGRYRIERELGEGGMATVYLADDLKHERKVALKVLKPELAAVVGAERFLAEIKTTANLQHPHILPLYDSGEADSLLFYVMPYVEGESLRDRLDRETQLPVDDAVRIATNMAEALDYAHRQGVVHRDIKPANVLLQDGKPVISDLGIALAVGTAGGGRLTETGLSLGTPHYMSPEQATGDQGVGPASDNYSLGCVLYEMLVGEPPYTGSTPQAVLGKIITADAPSARAGRPSVPPHLDAVIHRTLEKVPADRFQTAAEFKAALEDTTFRAAGGTAAGTASTGRGVNVLLAGGLVITTALAVWGGTRQPDADRSYRVVALDLSDLSEPSEALLPPDGTGVAVVADGALYVRDLDDLSFRELPNTSGVVTAAWSPDSEWLVFVVGDVVRKIHRSGEPASTLMRLPSTCAGGACGVSWMDDGRIIAAAGLSDLLVVSEDGGEAVPLVRPENEHFHGSLALPGGAVLIHADRDVGAGQAQLWDGETRHPRPDIGGSRVYGSGFVFHTREGDSWASRYSPSERTFVGDPLFVASRFRVLSAADDGTLLGIPFGGAAGDGEVRWIDREGEELEVLATLPDAAGDVRSPRLSGDGVLAYVVDGQVWTFDPRSGLHRPGPQGEGSQGFPSWSRDGRRLYYNETEVAGSPWAGVLKQFDLATGESTILARGGLSSSTSADGRYLAYEIGDAGQKELRYLDLNDPDPEPQVFTHGFAEESQIRLSPTGELGAFIARDRPGGRGDLFVSRFPNGEDLLRVAVDVWRVAGGWSADGSRLYYEQRGRLVEVGLRPGPAGSIAFGDPVDLFRLADIGIRGLNLAMGDDGSRFLVAGRGNEVMGTTLPDRLVMIQNWAPGR